MMMTIYNNQMKTMAVKMKMIMMIILMMTMTMRMTITTMVMMRMMMGDPFPKNGSFLFLSDSCFKIGQAFILITKNDLILNSTPENRL